jgi:hypothetical protein
LSTIAVELRLTTWPILFPQIYKKADLSLPKEDFMRVSHVRKHGRTAVFGLYNLSLKTTVKTVALKTAHFLGLKLRIGLDLEVGHFYLYFNHYFI